MLKFQLYVSKDDIQKVNQLLEKYVGKIPDKPTYIVKIDVSRPSYEFGPEGLIIEGPDYLVKIYQVSSRRYVSFDEIEEYASPEYRYVPQDKFEEFVDQLHKLERELEKKFNFTMDLLYELEDKMISRLRGIK